MGDGWEKGKCKMTFTVIDRHKWERAEYFEHYFSAVPCTYSMTFKLDITRFKKTGQKLYPAMLYCIATVVNRRREFRMALNKDGEVGFYDEMLPCYTVFHKDTELFSNVWTEYTENYRDFCSNYEADIAAYGNNAGTEGKPDVPENSFPVSMIPWASFESFTLGLQKGFDYLIPIFTMGKFYTENGKTLLPFAMQVHHSVCDGFHACRFFNELQELLLSGIFECGI